MEPFLPTRNSPPELAPESEVLIPLAHPQHLGLPFQRRELSRRIRSGDFPSAGVFRINGRLFSTLRHVEEYKAELMRRGALGAARDLSKARAARAQEQQQADTVAE